MNKKFYIIVDDKIDFCNTPTKKCSHNHYYYLASAAHELSKTYSKVYHLDSQGEIERCARPKICETEDHFSTRKKIVDFHKENYDFSGPWRPLENPFVSLLEKEFSDFITKLPYKVILNSRNVIGPYEIDVYLPERGVAFEFNGDYWHSNEMITQRYGISAIDYHTKKSNKCYEQEIKLAFIWEQNWLQSWETMIDLACDFIQFRRLEPLLTKFECPATPKDVYWEKVDRITIQKHREKIEKRLNKKLPNKLS